MPLWTPCPTVEHPAEWTPAECAAAWSPVHLDRGAALLEAVLREFPTPAAAIADLARMRTGGRFHAEMKAAADRLGISWRHIMLANISYDLALIAIACSTTAVATPRGPLLARNLDWWPEAELARAAVGIARRDGAQLVNWVAGWPGFSGVVTGMSGRGFALALNAVASPERVAVTGYPVLLFLRRVIDDARDFDEALAMLEGTRLASSCLVTLVGVRNDQRAVIERSPRRAKVRRPQGDEALVTTNDYRALYVDHDAGPLAELRGTACGRYDALSALVAAMSEDGRFDDTTLLSALTDRDVVQTITVQHVVMRPADQTGRAWVPTRLLG